NTFNVYQTGTDNIWKSQRFSLVCEYLSRPSLPPPLIFLSHLWRLFLFTAVQFSRTPACLKRSYKDHLQRARFSTKTKLDTTLDRLTLLDDKIRTLETKQGTVIDYLEHIMNGIRSIGGDVGNIPSRQASVTDLSARKASVTDLSASQETL
ncbi:unnamed protein product, partial [Didymodactylos carnosus]